jgi:hypothetical protein
MAQTLVIKYLVTLDTAKGLMDVDLKTSQGSEAAGRRAQWTLVASRKYGDIEDINVISVTTVCTWFGDCENPADGTEVHPFLGEVPCCNRCRSIGKKVMS